MSIDRKQELCELWLPVIYGDLGTVVESLDRCPHLINKVDPSGHTSLQVAAMYAHTDVVHELFARGADKSAEITGIAASKYTGVYGSVATHGDDAARTQRVDATNKLFRSWPTLRNAFWSPKIHHAVPHALRQCVWTVFYVASQLEAKRRTRTLEASANARGPQPTLPFDIYIRILGCLRAADWPADKETPG